MSLIKNVKDDHELLKSQKCGLVLVIDLMSKFQYFPLKILAQKLKKFLVKFSILTQTDRQSYQMLNFIINRYINFK